MKSIDTAPFDTLIEVWDRKDEQSKLVLKFKIKDGDALWLDKNAQNIEEADLACWQPISTPQSIDTLTDENRFLEKALQQATQFYEFVDKRMPPNFDIESEQECIYCDEWHHPSAMLPELTAWLRNNKMNEQKQFVFHCQSDEEFELLEHWSRELLAKRNDEKLNELKQKHQKLIEEKNKALCEKSDLASSHDKDLKGVVKAINARKREIKGLPVNDLIEVVRDFMNKSCTKPQPIESAPKDVDRLLGLCDGDWEVIRRDIFAGQPVWVSGIFMQQPTHWLPLPKIPEVTE